MFHIISSCHAFISNVVFHIYVSLKECTFFDFCGVSAILLHSSVSLLRRKEECNNYWKRGCSSHLTSAKRGRHWPVLQEKNKETSVGNW